ncbi:MAG: TlpA disulfide reductase family protein [Polyangiales bacterium]
MRVLGFALAGVLLSATAASALAPGDLPPPIEMPDQSGKRVDFQELEGKVVLVDFWASWCGPCKQEMPVLEALYRKYAAQGLRVIGVNIDSSSKKMTKFLNSAPVSFRIVHDPKLVVASKYEPAAMPSSYFIGRDGKVRYIHEGFGTKDAAEIEARIKALLAESANSD